VDDRDKDLTGLFVRDLDEIPLPARGAWRRKPGNGSTAMRGSRLLLTAGAVAAVLAIALIAGSQLNQRQQNVAATPIPSASPAGSIGSTASPSSAATPTGAYNDDFGFVVTQQNQGATTTVRRETGAGLGTFDQERFAVSPDGRRIAWFTPVGTQPQQLRVASASDLTKPQLLRTIAANERGGPIVWSNDASGLLYVVSVTSGVSGAAPETPSIYTVHTFDLHGTTTPDRAVLTSPGPGVVLQPYAWDRAANVASVGETGGGGFLTSYDVLRFNAAGDATTTKTAIQPIGEMLAYYVTASSDAKLLLGATFADGGSLMWWPIADFGSRKAITGSRNGFWRPQTHEVATIGGCAGDPACGPAGGVRLLDVEKGSSRIVYGAPVANMNVRTFRADGSAVIIYAPQVPGGGEYEYTLIPLPGGSPVTFKDVNGLGASVRLR
jgi:hypothetical protein